MIWKKGEKHPEGWPQWLKDADIEWCEVDIVDGEVVWEDGNWVNGIWKDGIWYDGVWENGTWVDGVWKGGRTQ